MTHELLKQAIAQKLLEKEALIAPLIDAVGNLAGMGVTLVSGARQLIKSKAAKKAAEKAAEEAAEKAVKAARKEKLKRAAELAGAVGLGGAISASLVGKKEKKKSK